MEKIIGTSTIVNGDSLTDIAKQNFCSYDLVTLDPPFIKDPEEVIKWIDHAVRIMKTNGNLVVFGRSEYIANIHALIYSKITSDKKYNLYSGLKLMDWVTTPQRCCNKTIYSALYSETMTLAFYTKDPANRKFYANTDLNIKNPGRVFSAEKAGVLTNLWNGVKHTAGRHGKFKEIEELKGQSLNHKYSTSWHIIKQLLYCTVQEGDSVYDAFGGAGTVPALCSQYNVNCRSVESEYDNFRIMEELCLRKTKKNKKLASIFKDLVHKTKDPYTNTEENDGRKKNEKSQDQFSQFKESKVQVGETY